MSSACTFSSSELSYLNDVLKDEAVGTKFTESGTLNAWDTQLSEFILLLSRFSFLFYIFLFFFFFISALLCFLILILFLYSQNSIISPPPSNFVSTVNDFGGDPFGSIIGKCMFFFQRAITINRFSRAIIRLSLIVYSSHAFLKIKVRYRQSAKVSANGCLKLTPRLSVSHDSVCQS